MSTTALPLRAIVGHFTCEALPGGGYVAWERCRYELLGPGSRHWLAQDAHTGILHLIGQPFIWQTLDDAKAAAAAFEEQQVE